MKISKFPSPGMKLNKQTQSGSKKSLVIKLQSISEVLPSPTLSFSSLRILWQPGTHWPKAAQKQVFVSYSWQFVFDMFDIRGFCPSLLFFPKERGKVGSNSIIFLFAKLLTITFGPPKVEVFLAGLGYKLFNSSSDRCPSPGLMSLKPDGR